MAAAYMATQYGNECWCSKEGLLEYEQHGQGIGKCDYECAGDAMETCGGRDAVSLRQLARPTFDKRVDVYQTNRTPGATVAAAVCSVVSAWWCCLLVLLLLMLTLLLMLAVL